VIAHAKGCKVPKRKLTKFFGTAITHYMAVISMEKEQLLKSCKLDSFGPHSSRMQMSMSRGVTIVKELGAFPKGMKCL